MGDLGSFSAEPVSAFRARVIKQREQAADD